MPVNTVALLKAADIVASQKEMKAAAKFSMKAAAATGLFTLIGGMIAGPPGLALGGASGGLCSWWATRGKFKSVVSIIKEDLSQHQKELLAQHLHAALQNLDITDFAQLAFIVMKEEKVLFAIMNGIKTFLETEMQMTIL